MKLFHLSDLHIGKQLHHYNLAAEQRKTLAQIVALAKSEHPDAILIAGDIYDTPCLRRRQCLSLMRFCQHYAR